MNFRWDPRKAIANARKHGVTVREVATILRDPLSTTFPDVEHSQDEQRYATIGLSSEEKLLVVAHTERDDEIRIISARRATKAEHRFCEEKT